jgi:hypothetical protein
MTDVFSKLAAPFPKEAISWRAQSLTKDKTKAQALAYIDARDVQDRLDAVLGPGNWQNRYPHTQGKTVCEIGVRVDGEWIWKADGAGDTDVEAEKGALSDAFKRAAVKWGIGRYLYDMTVPWVPCEVNDAGKFKRFLHDPWKYVSTTQPTRQQEASSDITGGEDPETAAKNWTDGEILFFNDASPDQAAERLNQPRHEAFRKSLAKKYPEMYAKLDTAIKAALGGN